MGYVWCLEDSTIHLCLCCRLCADDGRRVGLLVGSTLGRAGVVFLGCKHSTTPLPLCSVCVCVGGCVVVRCRGGVDSSVTDWVNVRMWSKGAGSMCVLRVVVGGAAAVCQLRLKLVAAQNNSQIASSQIASTCDCDQLQHLEQACLSMQAGSNNTNNSTTSWAAICQWESGGNKMAPKHSNKARHHKTAPQLLKQARQHSAQNV